ncbi:holocytochrome c synthase [Cladochytrium tenue]|nr:holocytochrome c synthase [Cladochytrium tenue]
MGWFDFLGGGNPSTPAAPPAATTSTAASRCPVDHSKASVAATSGASCPVDHANSTGSRLGNRPGGGCPVDHRSQPPATAAAGVAARCPVDHAGSQKLPEGHPPVKSTVAEASRSGSEFDPHGSSRTSDMLNPANMMPTHSNAVSDGQQAQLSIEREISSIPKGDGGNADDSLWEYPSPQGFYNALKRKGKEAPEEHIPAMVAIHNFLNEACWSEIQKWEQKYHCDCKDLRLTKFRGRPDELSPKARLSGLLYGSPRPFDRHDWTVDRCGSQVRYVIDYYGAPDEDGSPVFHVDVRPALDSPSSIFDRARDAMSSMWS